jgi:hypothetical protein
MTIELSSDGATWRLRNVDDWIAGLPTIGASAIANSIEDGGARVIAEGIQASAQAIASWSESAAAALGLPPSTPLGFDIRLSGAMGKPGATIAVRWLQPGRTVSVRDAVRDGPWLRSGDRIWRVPSPIFDVLALVDSFNAAPQDSLEDQFRLWARIRSQLGEENAEALTDGFLRSFRVVTASALTFGITTDSRGDVQIEPVLLTSRRAADGEALEQVRALTEVDEALFPKRLDQLREGALAFPISQGTYVVVDEALQQALAAVRGLRRAPPEQRKRAAMFPEAVIRERLGAPHDAPTAFVETERYADRVRDIGEWSTPILPWIKIESQDWGAPKSCGVRIAGKDVPLDPAALSTAVTDMRAAIAAGKDKVEVRGQSIPATPSNLKALERLHRAVESRDKGKPTRDEEGERGTQVLIIEDNLDERDFNRTRVGSRPGTADPPEGIRTAAKPHQRVGIRWLQRHWIDGSRGVLLCDDMGLGKTFQALAFCRWLRDLIETGKIQRRPILIVAPVGLLRNWEAEIEEHLLSPGLGSLVRAYGEHLRGLRRGRHVDGTAGLDTAGLARGDVVLANYEAVSDYQLSFGAVPFVAAILDEAQKIKSPQARVTNATKALNADFVVAMTGTPVENRLADLWCIADAVQPGALADLKEFSAKYETTGADVGALRRLLWHDESESEALPPKMLLRRLKTDKLEGLPRKHEHVISTPMPSRQAEAYGRALAMKEISGPEGTLGMIHALRRVSLHPALLEGDVRNEELRVEDSARMTSTLEVLDRVAEAGEKALVFLESLDLQDADQLPLVLKRRYGLSRLPMVINGQVATEARQARVNDFQSGRGFDVMLLSPKAGGVGLTLTAANHVVHLSRWWNPAVEDQCSDRVYRIGQTRPVHIYYPLAVLPDAQEYSFDVQLQNLMHRKRKLAQDLLAAPAFTAEDYQALVKGTLRSTRSI